MARGIWLGHSCCTKVALGFRCQLLTNRKAMGQKRVVTPTIWLVAMLIVEWNESGVYGQVELLVGHWSTINSLIHTKAWHKTRRPNKPQRVKCNLPARSNLHAVACCYPPHVSLIQSFIASFYSQCQTMKWILQKVIYAYMLGPARVNAEFSSYADMVFDPDQDPEEKRNVRQNYRSLTKKIEGGPNSDLNTCSISQTFP